MLTTYHVLLICAVTLAVTFAVGCLISWRRLGLDVLDAHDKAVQIRATAQVTVKEIQASNHQKDVEKILALTQALDQEVTENEKEQAEFEEELEQRQEAIDRVEASLIQLETEFAAHEQQINEKETALINRQDEIKAQENSIRPKLAEHAGMTEEEAHEYLVNDKIERARHLIQKNQAHAEAQLENQAQDSARHIFDITCDRFSGVPDPERWNNSIPVESKPLLELLVNQESDLMQALLKALECEIWADEETSSVHIKSESPLVRERARRVMKDVIQYDIRAPHLLDRLISRVRTQVDEDVVKAGKQALKSLGITEMDQDLVNLIGNLKFRLSYSQNQWHHVLESATLAGLVAGEMGLDTAKAKRAAILHDIGKAISHEQEGSHAIIGAQILEEHHEEPDIINAVAAHHGDVPGNSPLAPLVALSDALSGGRPGARREMVTAYMNRLAKLEEVVTDFEEVRRIDVMHAGREVRVFVGEDELEVLPGASKPVPIVETDEGLQNASAAPKAPIPTDAELQPLARKIADSIQDKMEFPGQIKVTVIRETRMVAYAR